MDENVNNNIDVNALVDRYTRIMIIGLIGLDEAVVIGFFVMQLKNMAILSLLLIIIIVVVGLPESLGTIMNVKSSERNITVPKTTIDAKKIKNLLKVN